MKTFLQKVMSFIPAWIQDVNYTVNPGFIKLKNGFINPLGKIQKRKGWETKFRWWPQGKPPGQEGNLPIDYTYPVNGSDSCARTNFIHIKSKLQSDGSIHKFCLVHRILNGKNALMKYTFDENGNFIGQTQIGTPEQFTNYGPVKFIETNDQVYIINTFNKMDGSKKLGYIWKYAYGNNIKNLDTERIQNISISNSVYAKTEIISGTGMVGLETGTYFYYVMPVYNTGSIGRIDGTSFIQTAAQATITTNNQSVVVKVLSAYDPYIIAYRIFRTKKNSATISNAYFLGQYNKPDNSNSTTALLELVDPNSTIHIIGGVQRRFTDTNTLDTALGSKMDSVYFLNSYKHEWSNGYPNSRGMDIPSTALDNNLNFPVSCGCYAQGRLILGYGNRLMFSLLDHSDSIDGTLTMIIPLANETENPVIAIEEAGPWIFAFCKSAIYKLMPTSDLLAPYQLQIVSNTFGCDSLTSITVLDGIAYFISRNKLYAMNAFGQIKLIGGPIESVFNEAIDTINISRNEKEKFIKFMFRTASGSREVDFWYDANYFIDEEGYRDIFTPDGTNVDLLQKDPRYKLLAYEYNLTTGEEWGVTFDGDVVRRGNDHIDKSTASTVKNWQDYTYLESVNPVDNYNVNLIFEKAFSYSERVQFNSLLLYGTGFVYVSYAKDASEDYSTEKRIALKRDGVETAIDVQAFTCKIRVRHEEADNIDLDYFALKITSSGKVDFLNTVDGGEE